MSRGDWMRTRSGGRFYPADPRADEVHIIDIASGLSKECRYGGQLEEMYSVAEHSILVASVLPDHLKLQGLLHDAPEAYLRDMVRPAKVLMPEYYALEAKAWAAVAARFGLPLELDPLVKQADNDVLLAEKAQLFAEDTSEWSIKGTPADVFLHCWDYKAAEAEFLRYFHHLTKGIYL